MAEYWQRSSSIYFPTIWKRFSRINPISGKVETFVIQDIPETLYETVIEFMTKYFHASEPMRICTDFSCDQTSVTEEQELWRRALKQRLSLICFVKKRNGRVQIACIFINSRQGLNDDQPVLQGRTLRNITSLTNFMIHSNRLYQEFNITELVISIGGVISSKFDVPFIIYSMLESRKLLCRAIGIETNIFFALTKLDEDLLAIAGYKPYTVMTYQQLASIDRRFYLPGIQYYGQRISLMYTFYR